MSNMESNVHTLIKKASETDKSEDAMRFSQAACNAANALACLANTAAQKK